MTTPHLLRALPLALLAIAGSVEAAPRKAPPPAPQAPAAPGPLETTPEGQAALKAWEQAGHAWTPKVRAAYLAFAKAQVMKELADAGQADKFPADFLAFVDQDPQVALTIYGFQPAGAANRLRLLRSLELDLGKETVRGDKYRQLALAMVAVRANGEGPKADLTERAPMKFEIPKDPRVIVDTKPKDRPLDVNDHIINFLNDHAPIPDDGRTHRVVWPELAYDANGKAIGSDKVQPKEIAPTEAPQDGTKPPQKMRRIYASDVIASAQIEKEFNDYMAAHGQSVRVDCGMPSSPARLHWRSTEAKGVNGRGITAAYYLFLNAYKAKGYFPAQPDPAPTAAESLAYYRMIGDFEAPPEAKMKGPRFAFTQAPWPILVYLAQDTQSVRGRADMWDRYIRTGEFHGYGEYTGGIAQIPVLQRARRLTPFAFENNTVQMMAKDGGVCGTMGKLAVYDMACLGAPASTAGQPGHCCLVRIVGGPGAYNLVGGQYATGGDRSTDPHNPFIFDGGSHQYMLIHQSVPHAVNAGMDSFLDTLAARSFFLALPGNLRQAHGLPLLCSAIELNPYNVAVINQAQAAAAAAPLDFVAIRKAKANGLSKVAGKTGCPPDTGMFVLKREEAYAKLAKMPVPENPAEAAAVLALLREEKCAVAQLITDYTLAAEGIAGAKALVEKLETDFKAHVAGGRNPGICAAMAKRITELADSKCPEEIMQPCLDRLRQEMKGREGYNFKQATARSMWYSGVDACATTLAKLAVDRKIAKAGLPAFIAETEAAFKAYAASARTDASSAFMTDALATILAQWTDKKQAKAWAAARLKEIEGREKFVGGHGSALVAKIDPSVALLARHAGAPLRADKEMTQSLLDELTAELKRHAASERTLPGAQATVFRLNAGAAAIRDPQQKLAWVGGLAAILRGKETFEVLVPGKKPRVQRDPAADMVAATVALEIRAAGKAGNQPAYATWVAIADTLPPAAPADVFLTPQQAAAHPKMEPFSGQLLSAEGLLRASSACGFDRPLTYKSILSPGMGGWLHTNAEAKPWLQVDLPADSELSGIVLVGRYEHPKESPTRTGALPMKVQTSLDGKAWTDVATFDKVEDVYRVDLEGRKTKARHIRVERAPAAGQKAGDFEFRNVLVYGTKSH